MKGRFRLHVAAVALFAVASLQPLVSAMAQPVGPYLESGKIESAVVHITAVPAAPKVRIRVKGKISTIRFDWYGPSNQILNQSFYIGLVSGEYLFQAADGEGTFLPFAAAGTWTLGAIGLCSEKNCNEFTGTQLASLFPSLSIQVVNPKSDTMPPQINSADLLTPVVKASADARITLSVSLQDNLSGALLFAVLFGSGGKNGSVQVGGYLTHPIVAPETYTFVSACGCAKLPAGSYTATVVTVTDAAGNETQIDDPATISALFGGSDTLTLTN